MSNRPVWQLQNSHHNLKHYLLDMIVLLLVFGSLMLWLWQIRYKTFAPNGMEEDLAKFSYGLVLISVPLLCLRWLGFVFSTRSFVLLAASGVFLAHLAIDGMSVAGLMYVYLGMPSIATLTIATLATIRLLGNKPRLLLPDQLDCFAAGVLIAMLVQLCIQVIFGVLSADGYAARSLHDGEFLSVVGWLSGVWVVGCVLCAFFCQWRGQHLCSLWLVGALIGWVLDGAMHYQHDQQQQDVQREYFQSRWRGAETLCDCPDLMREGVANVTPVVFRSRLLGDGEGFCVTPLSGDCLWLSYAQQASRVPAPNGEVISYLDEASSLWRRQNVLSAWLSDWFASSAALLWLLRGVGALRRRKGR